MLIVQSVNAVNCWMMQTSSTRLKAEQEQCKNHTAMHTTI